MSEGFPDRAPSKSELESMVELWKQDITKLSDPRPLYAAALLARDQALDRGDPRVIEETEMRLNDILAVYPEVDREN